MYHVLHITPPFITRTCPFLYCFKVLIAPFYLLFNNTVVFIVIFFISIVIITKDLGSKAGTFVNGKKLIADEEIRLVSGANISIGNAGANYTWIIPSEV